MAEEAATIIFDVRRQIAIEDDAECQVVRKVAQAATMQNPVRRILANDFMEYFR